MVDGDRLFVAAGSGTRLELLEVQVEGKKRMPVADFLRGAAPHPHESLGSVMIAPARKAAFELLLELKRKPESHSDVLLRSKRVEALSPLDKNLATTLVMGVLRWQLVLQQRIREVLTRSKGHLADAVQVSLELGALQLTVARSHPGARRYF